MSRLLLTFFTSLLLSLTTLASERGLAFNDPNMIRNFDGAGTQATWGYNWDSAMPSTFPGYLEFVPMLWGDGSDHTSNWFNNVNNAITRGSAHILAFNEPDACGWGQACMSPRAAANAYRQYMMPYAGQVALGAPAVTNGPNGLNWLQDFLNACSGCKIDFVPIHWYDSAINYEYFYHYLMQAYDIARVNIWITEFNGSGTQDQRVAFMQLMLPWMDQQNWIDRYAWFMVSPTADGGLVDGNGNPNVLGQTYAYTGF